MHTQISDEFKPFISDIYNGVTKGILKIPNSQTHMY